MLGMDARLLRVIATAGASYLGRFGSGVVILVTLPMARQSLQPELFGVWMMLSAFLGFMAFADLGIGNGVLNKATEAHATGNNALLRRVLISGYACTGTVGAALLLAWFAWSRLDSNPSIVAGVISPQRRGEVMAAFDVFALVLAINIPACLIQRVQLGLQQGYWNGIAQFCGALITLVAVPLTLHHGGGVPQLVMATLGAQTTVNIINTLIWLHSRKLLNPLAWLDSFDMATVRGLLRTGSMFFLLQLAAAFAFQSDAIVITQTRGQAAYGDFAVVQKLFLFVSMLLNASMLGLWPAFGDAIARKDMAWAARTLRRGVVTAAAVSIGSVTVLAAAIPWIMTHWMHAAIAPPWSLVTALAVWTVIDAMATVVAAFMNGANILRMQLVFAVCMSLTAFSLKWLLTPSHGATGAVLSTILAYSLISVPAQIYILKQAFGTKD